MGPLAQLDCQFYFHVYTQIEAYTDWLSSYPSRTVHKRYSIASEAVSLIFFLASIFFWCAIRLKFSRTYHKSQIGYQPSDSNNKTQKK